MKILLVEDDKEFAEAIQLVLENHHYLVDLVTDGVAGQTMAEAFDYDLLLLDWMLPERDGVQVCNQLRARGDRTPVLLMTARDAETDKVLGLDAGADDYLVKPFGMQELLARLRALLRRAIGEPSPLLWWGRWLCLDPRSHEVISHGTAKPTPVPLTPLEYRLLELFLRSPQRVFSSNALIDSAWPLDKPPTSSVVRSHIKAIRQKLAQVGLLNVIDTVYGVGYRLALPEVAQSQVKNVVKDVVTTSEQSSLRVASPKLGNADAAKKVVLATLWRGVEDIYRQRVTHLLDTLLVLESKELDPAVIEQLTREAHALAGSLGTFGFLEIMQPLKEIERILRSNVRFSVQQVQQLGILISQVQQGLAQVSEPTVHESGERI